MVIVLKNDITVSEKENIKQILTEKNFKLNEVTGEESTIIAAVGKVSMDLREVEILPGVDHVVPISKPYKMASREYKSEDTIVEISNSRGQIIRIGGKRIVSIAGPCAVESRSQMMEIAEAVAESGAVMLRGGAYKPRTSPYSFQGLGEEGLKYLKEAGEKFGLPVVTEIVDAENIPVMKDYVDVYQIGARNMQNFELLKKLGVLGKPVILKRGLSASIEEWLMSAEYLLSSGTDKVILCERGIKTYERATRNTLDLSAVPVLRSMTHLPIIVDPSHAVGIRDKIPPMGLAAIAGGADGIIVEVHNHPEKALSDGPQSLYPEQFDKLMQDIKYLAPVVGKEVASIRRVDSICVESEHKNIEGKIKCAFNGEKGAYAEMAVEDYFGDSVEAASVKGFDEIFQDVLDGKYDFGMVPIENSTAGSVYQNYDNFSRYDDISIVGAISLKIQHALLAPKGAALETVKNVYSHPQGFYQCSNFLKSFGWNLVDTVSTATGALLVSKKNDISCAAIANRRNAKLYNLEILKDNVEDNPNNYTRFVIIAANHVENNRIKAALKAGEPNRASFVFTTKNEPGALYDCLGVFKEAGLNLNRLESRPIPGSPWSYRFFADAAVNVTKSETPQQLIENFLAKFKKTADEIRLLGLYRE